MDASSSVHFCTEESPDMAMVGEQWAPTSGRSEYYSARCEAMMQSKSHFADDVAQEMAFSKAHWSEVRRREVAPRSAAEEELNRENREVFQQLQQLQQLHPSFFVQRMPLVSSPVALGRMIAKGGQAEIYEVVDQPAYLLKVFQQGTSLRELQRSWPTPVLNEKVVQCVHYALMLDDGRFAFWMHKCWGDLRKLIDQAMQAKNVDGNYGPPFPYQWNGRIYHTTDLMWQIAEGMRALHEQGVVHRDLKASNILLKETTMVFNLVVADFECSIGVLGTGFWRAPEVLLAIESRAMEEITQEQWEKADVYSYGMTCFEIVTGRIPFDGEVENTKAGRKLVMDGRRPKLPRDLDDGVKGLIIKCWDSNPLLRPTFFQIVDIVQEGFSLNHFE